MSQDRERYIYFTVGLLKNSSTLDALWQDALKYHMIDQPGKLIALRLTEHYEMMARGDVLAGMGISITALSKANGNGHHKENIPSAPSNDANASGDYRSNDEGIIAASPDADQNADDAAEYWSQL